MTDIQFLISILAGGVVLASPILFASIGETYAQRSGVINLGLEGIMLLTGFIALWITFETRDFLLGTLAAAFVGALIALIHSFASITMRVNQLISGLLIFLLATGMAGFLNSIVIANIRLKAIEDPFSVTTLVPSVTPIPPFIFPVMSEIPLLGPILFKQNVFVYLSFISALILGFILYKTSWGLTVRGVGENPEACDAAGINVNRVRHLCVIIGGTMTGLAGAAVTLGFIGLYDNSIIAGRGWVAIIVVVFARWNPYRAILGSLIFGIGFSLSANLIGAGTSVSIGNFFLTIPYLLALLLIVLQSLEILVNKSNVKFKIKRNPGPSSLTVPYWRK